MEFRVKALPAAEVQQYRAEAKSINGFTNLMREHFEMTYDRYIGYRKEEFEEVIIETSDSIKKNFLSELRPRGDGCETLKQAACNDWSSRNYERMLGCAVPREDGKYNIIVVKASQIKEIEGKTLAACGIGAVALGVIAGVALGPVGMGLVAANFAAGIGCGVVGAGGLAINAKVDNEKNNMSDVVCGYIIHELERRNVLSIRNNQIVITA